VSAENVLDNIPIILKAVRIHRGISQVTLVRKMNEISSCEPPITQGYISKLETGKVPIVLDKITLFTDALGCPKEADNLAWLIEQFQIQQKAEAASRSKNNI
jgi:transcriptional regulator with XRE-family HTH domain